MQFVKCGCFFGKRVALSMCSTLFLHHKHNETMIRVLKILFAVTMLSVSASAQTTTSSGLVYRIAKAGNANTPREGDQVWVEYTGMLTDGTVFASTAEYGCIDFYLGQGMLIKGWEEGLQLIGEGGVIELTVPPTLGYGDLETEDIPSGSTLHFVIKVVQVNKHQQIRPFDISGKKLKKLPNGIKYYVVKEGTGNAPKKGDNAYVHYTGWLDNGSIFGTSVHKSNPMRITVGGGEVIEGWDYILGLMKPGSKVRALIPSNLAFGAEGYGIQVPANASISLDLELVRVSPQVIVEKWNAAGRDTLHTPSGVGYVVFEQGEGTTIQPNSIVTAHYSAYLTDGTLVESSVKRETPVKFPTNAGMILDGWEDAMPLMRKGSKFQLLVPSFLAYGSENVEGVPANSDMIFDIEIIDVME